MSTSRIITSTLVKGLVPTLAKYRRLSKILETNCKVYTSLIKDLKFQR